LVRAFVDGFGVGDAQAAHGQGSKTLLFTLTFFR
jgi:hypothetical protein